MGRKKVVGQVDDSTHTAWHMFARAYDVDISAFLEALGRRLGELDQPESRLPAIIRDSVREAREIKWQRKRR